MVEKNKKTSNVKLFFKKLKELWGNPRGRAALLLGFYGCFLLFVVGGVRTNLTTEQKRKDQPSNLDEKTISFDTMTNYEFEMKVSKNNELTIFQGKRYGLYHQFINTVTNQSYYMEDKMIYQLLDGVKTPLIEPISTIDLMKFQPDFLAKLIEQSTLDYTTTYESGMVKKSYMLSLSTFMKLMYGTTIHSNEIVTIMVTEKDTNIEQISLDLLAYQKTIDHDSTGMTIEITYKNVGTVPSFHID